MNNIESLQIELLKNISDASVALLQIHGLESQFPGAISAYRELWLGKHSWNLEMTDVEAIAFFAHCEFTVVDGQLRVEDYFFGNTDKYVWSRAGEVWQPALIQKDEDEELPESVNEGDDLFNGDY